MGVGGLLDSSSKLEGEGEKIQADWELEEPGSGGRGDQYGEFSFK